MKPEFPYSTTQLPDGVVIGGPWPNTIITWPNGKSRNATKPEHDLFQAMESSQSINATLLAACEAALLNISAFDAKMPLAKQLRAAIALAKGSA